MQDGMEYQTSYKDRNRVTGVKKPFKTLVNFPERDDKYDNDGNDIDCDCEVEGIVKIVLQSSKCFLHFNLTNLLQHLSMNMPQK